MGQTMRPPTTYLVFAACVAALMPLAGCREGSSYDAKERQLTIHLDEYLLRPQNIQTKSGRLQLTVVNDGARVHNLRIKLGRRDLGGTGTLAPGERATVSVSVPSGSYRVGSTLSNDETLGLYGSLTVR